MHMGIVGALTGAGVGAVLFLIELMTVRKRAAERAERKHQPLTLDANDRRQLASNARFCLCVPPAFAAFFWLVWG